jgi:hypothetical protein
VTTNPQLRKQKAHALLHGLRKSWTKALMALVIGYSPLLMLLGLLDKLRRTINHKTSSHLKNYRSDKPETARNSN